MWIRNQAGWRWGNDWRVMRGIFLVLVTAMTIMGGQIGLTQEAAQTRRWYKGNLHTHTINSDGDSSSESWFEFEKRSETVYTS